MAKGAGQAAQSRGAGGEAVGVDAAGGKAKGRRGLQAQKQAVGQGETVQLRRPRKDSWTKAQRQLFLETLAETCNASEAAREAGICRATAYRLKLRDPRFAADWERAMDIGYSEIELMLMREARFGSEEEEVVLDGEGAVKTRKVKRKRDLKLALQLLARYRDKVAAYRAAAGVERPDSENAIKRMRRVLEDVRRKRALEGT